MTKKGCMVSFLSGYFSPPLFPSPHTPQPALLFQFQIAT